LSTQRPFPDPSPSRPCPHAAREISKLLERDRKRPWALGDEHHRLVHHDSTRFGMTSVVSRKTSAKICGVAFWTLWSIYREVRHRATLRECPRRRIRPNKTHFRSHGVAIRSSIWREFPLSDDRLPISATKRLDGHLPAHDVPAAAAQETLRTLTLSLEDRLAHTQPNYKAW
jgi:hypothetical protein